MTSPPRRRLVFAERGQTTLLTIGYAVIAMLLVTIVVNLSRVFLAQRALDAAADEAAVAAVQAVKERPYYDEGAGRQLPLAAQADAYGAADDHLEAANASETCDGFGLDSVVPGKIEGSGDDPATRSMTVTVSCRVRIPFANLVTGQYAHGVPIKGQATARQTVRT